MTTIQIATIVITLVVIPLFCVLIWRTLEREDDRFREEQERRRRRDFEAWKKNYRRNR